MTMASIKRTAEEEEYLKSDLAKEEVTGIRAFPSDEFEYRERESSVRERATPWSALIPPEYYETRKKEADERFKRQQRKEHGRLKAASIADTLRLVGHGIGISKGAYETPWGDNRQVSTGFRNLDEYTTEHAAALEKLRDLALAQKESDRRWNYVTRRDDIRDQVEARIDDDTDKKYIDDRRGLQKEREAEAAREAARDKADAADAAARRNIDRAELELKRQVAGRRGGDELPEVIEHTDTSTGYIYSFNPNEPNDMEALSRQADAWLQTPEGASELAIWKRTNSAEYAAISSMRDPHKAWTRDGIASILPIIFNAGIANMHEVSRRPSNRRDAPPGPSELERNMNIFPGGIFEGGVSRAPAQPVTPAQAVMQKAQEERIKKEPVSEEISLEGISQREAMRMRDRDFHKIPPQHRETAMQVYLIEYGRKADEGNLTDNDIERVAKRFEDYYRHVRPEISVRIDEIARKQGVSPADIIVQLIHINGVENIRKMLNPQ